MCPQYVQRSPRPSGLGSPSHPEPLRAPSAAPTPAEAAPATPSAGPGVRAARRASERRLRPRPPGPATDRPSAAVPAGRRAARGDPGGSAEPEGLRRARRRRFSAGSMPDACLVPTRVPLSSAHASLTCSPPGRLSRPGWHTRQAAVPGTERALPRWARRGPLAPGYSDTSLFIRLPRTSRLSGLRAPPRPGSPAGRCPRAAPLLAARRFQLLEQGSARGVSLPRRKV